MDWNYLAGFLDGEGSIIKRKKNEKVSIRITIPNTNKEVIDAIATFTGCGHIHYSHRNPGKWRPQYQWYVGRHRDCQYILEKLMDKLIVKKDKCMEALEIIHKQVWFDELVSRDQVGQYAHLSTREMGKQLGLSHTTAWRYKRKYADLV